ncbi:TPA: HipA domain-containing protein, partial [Escherichia coli]|nr:HipA domain-containing protein [Escherichia coli]
IGGNATGIGTLNVQDQDSVITVRRLYNGYFGNGTVNISNNGLINNKEYSLVGVQDGSHGVVNVTDKGHWNFLGTGEAFRYIYIGDAGDGELNVSSEGKVDSGIITAGMKETGTGNITVKDKNSVITNLGTNLGYDGHGEMNISNQGLVVSNGGSSLGYGETGVGNVSITTGGMWEVNKNVYTTIGVAGVGNLNISDGGKFVSQNITFLGDKASGIGTLNLMDATSSFDTVGINVGNFGSGIVNVSNGATLNSTGYGFIGGNASGKGIVNISTDSLWNLKTSSTNAQLLQVGVLGTGELNITTGGIVKARDTQIALNDKSKGDVRVDGQNSLLETFNMYVGTSGTGTLTLTNNGTLNVEGGEVYLGVFEPAVGTLNIGAAHGEAAADAGFITNATKVEFGLGEGVFVFNHTNNSDAGYQVDMLITGDDKDGKVIHDAGHTVFNAGNTYSGKTLVNDGLLTIASHTADGVTGMGSSEVTIANPGTLDILASTNSAGDYTLTNALKGDGLMRVQLSSSDKMFGFTHATGTEFAGVAQLKDSTFTLERDNTAALTHAMLQSDSENTTSVKVGEQSIGGLAMNGGTIIFDTDIPAATLAEGYISVDTLVVGAGDYTWKGRNYQVNGTGDVLIDVPKPWNDPMANNPLTTLNLLEHDDSHVGVQLVKAQTVIGSGGSLTLRDLQGDEVEADKTLHIAQNGTVVAEGDYGFRLTTAPGNGLYVNYGLKALNIHGGQKLTLAEHGGAYGATADMSAKIGGEGDLAINTVRQVSLSNGQNDYQGATYVQMGTLRTDADGALGNTRELNISNAAIVDLNGSTQTVETFTGQMGSTVLFKEGALTVNKGGISQGELTGGGNLNVTGGTLAIEGLNARYNALTSISPNAEVSLDNTQGLGRGNIANDGLLTLKFDLLSEIGRDSVGAVTLIPEDETVTHPIMAWEKLTEARLEEVLTAYKADIPLGMIREENDFRISVAGAQEKTALLRIGNDWCIPKGITPTTHIIKLPIGEIRQPNATLDLSQSVDNEYYCLLLAKELGLNVPDAEIIKAGNVRALAVERFDRRWNAERTVLLRLPQEDMCQTFGLPSSVKYESDGGPGIARIMAFLMGSSEALKDRYDFMKFQVFQWLIGATDGHAKNFSVFIQAGGSYRLTPFYDIISAFPVLGGTGIH